MGNEEIPCYPFFILVWGQFQSNREGYKKGKRTEEIKSIKTNLTKKESEIERIEYNFATASTAREREICSKQLTKVEAERDEILRQLEERDKSILNLSDYVNSGLEIKDNMLKLWQLGNLSQKKRVQTMIFPDGLVYDKKNDDIEPLSKNEFMFVFDLKSVGYEESKRLQSYVLIRER